MMEIPTCKKCKKAPIYLEHSSKYCIRCYEARKAANATYQNSHKQEAKERTKRWRLAHPEKSKEYSEKSRQKPSNKLISKIGKREWKQSEAGKISEKKYRETHKIQLAEYQRLYREKNKVKISQRISKWAEANREKLRGYVKKYNQNHPEQVTKSSRRRREIFKHIDGNFNLLEWETLCDSFGNKCLWCGKVNIRLSVDHVVPVSKGGSNFIHNLQPLCVNCNSKKGNKILDFRPFGTTILEWT